MIRGGAAGGPLCRCDLIMLFSDYRQFMTAVRPEPEESILIADDDEAFGHVLATLLETAGYRCQCVCDAAGAIAALQRGDFPLLISDIGMPGNDNLELVQTLATMPQRPRIILLTGNPSIPTATKAVGLPVTAYLTKPPDRLELLRLVGEALADSRASRALAASQRRVQSWADDLARVQSLLQRAPESESGRYFQAYLTLTLSNLVNAVSDVGRMIEIMETGETPRHRENAALITALQEAVIVLEKTRRNFHSKDLAALRKKLELLLAGS